MNSENLVSGSNPNRIKMQRSVGKRSLAAGISMLIIPEYKQGNADDKLKFSFEGGNFQIVPRV